MLFRYTLHMKFKSIITFSILFVLSLSIVHEFTFTMLDENQCSVSDFVTELEKPIECGDICDIHFKYHQVYILSYQNTLVAKIDKISELLLKKEIYKQKTIQDLVIPPLV